MQTSQKISIYSKRQAFEARFRTPRTQKKIDRAQVSWKTWTFWDIWKISYDAKFTEGRHAPFDKILKHGFKLFKPQQKTRPSPRSVGKSARSEIFDFPVNAQKVGLLPVDDKQRAPLHPCGVDKRNIAVFFPCFRVLWCAACLLLLELRAALHCQIICLLYLQVFVYLCTILCDHRYIYIVLLFQKQESARTLIVLNETGGKNSIMSRTHARGRQIDWWTTGEEVGWYMVGSADNNVRASSGHGGLTCYTLALRFERKVSREVS